VSFQHLPILAQNATLYIIPPKDKIVKSFWKFFCFGVVWTKEISPMRGCVCTFSVGGDFTSRVYFHGILSVGKYFMFRLEKGRKMGYNREKEEKRAR
jgi:hypothetical protein